MAQPVDRFIPRRLMDVAMESLAAFRVLVIQGARQVGKSTLALTLAKRHGAAVVSLDNADDLAAARNDPRTFLDVLGTPLVIDEVQRVGEPLVLAVKVVVDWDNQPGRFILTGSSNFLTVPTISESLAGRVDITTLWPLSQGELTGGRDEFVDRGFRGIDLLLDHKGPTPERDDYFDRLCTGGYPAVQKLGERARRRWFDQYVDTVLRREIEVAGDIRRADALAGMIRYFAGTTGQELVLSTLAQRLGIDRATAASYQPWLETVFLIHRVPSWSRNLTAKVVKRPKLYVSDSGIAANLLGKQTAALRRPTDPAAGPLFETFIVNELAKQLTWSDTPARLFHFRDREGAEVDIILEAADGRVIAVEGKATSTPRHEDFRGLALVRDRVDRAEGEFVAGVVLHTGTRRLSFGDRLVALPAADVWS
ncbi:MAG: ATP-binding protein [Actinomycetota bacterium]|nr:ATP-binding protein [Actinomycetota bacterium]